MRLRPPGINPAIRSPLMIQVVLGFDAARIARVFAVPPTTLAQCLVRANRCIRDAGIPFRTPTRPELPERLPAVLEAIYGAYAIDWLDQHERTPRIDRRGGTVARRAHRNPARSPARGVGRHLPALARASGDRTDRGRHRSPGRTHHAG